MLVQKEQPIKVGQHYKGESAEYMLFQSQTKDSYKCNLIGLVNIQSGCTWNPLVEVENTRYITKEEFKKICSTGNFTLVGDKAYIDKIKIGSRLVSANGTEYILIEIGVTAFLIDLASGVNYIDLMYTDGAYVSLDDFNRCTGDMQLMLKE